MPTKKDSSKEKVTRSAAPIMFGTNSPRPLTDPKEIRSYKMFWKEHMACRGDGKYGGITTIRSSNGIGDNLYMLCGTCKRWEDIANVGSW